MQKRDKKEVFLRAVSSLEAALREPIRIDRDRAGIIQNFEFSYEATWKFLKTCLAHEGRSAPASPRKVYELSYQTGLIDNEKEWLQMIEDRNLTTHTYDPKLAEEVVHRVHKIYLPLFQSVRAKHAS